MICLGKTYIAINKNEVEKAHSSSGGCFYPIAASVIQAGGAVFGVAMNEDFRAAHECAWTLEEARRFCGSKYLRSDLGQLSEGRKDFGTGKMRFIYWDAMPVRRA